MFVGGQTRKIMGVTGTPIRMAPATKNKKGESGLMASEQQGQKMPLPEETVEEKMALTNHLPIR
jgi:hypothetical protein